MTCVFVNRFGTSMCCFNAFLVISASSECAIPVITVIVDEPRSKRSPADEPSFSTRLTDPDRGIRGKGEDEFPQRTDNFPSLPPPGSAQRARPTTPGGA